MGLLTFRVFFPSAYISTSEKCLDSLLTSLLNSLLDFSLGFPFTESSLRWEICHKLSAG